MKRPIRQRIAELTAEANAIVDELDEMGEHAPAELRQRVEKSREYLLEIEAQRRDTQATLEGLRRSARRERPAYEAMTIEIPKWRTVILLGLNSAAIAAVLGNENLASQTVKASSMFFLAGALLALASGSMLDSIGRTGLEYADELDRADIDEETNEDHGLVKATKAVENLRRSRFAAESLRFTSILLFAAGVIFAAFQFRL